MISVFKILWGIDALAAVVILWFFIVGVLDGTVTHRNIKLWLFILLLAGSILWISLLLKRQGHDKYAMLTVLIIAIPAIIYGLFVLLMAFNNGRWN
jgi:hypothetical protein